MIAITAIAMMGFGPLDAYPPIARGRTDFRQIALTIDDGPNPNTTPDILKVLRKHSARATFFVIGRRVELYPDLVRQIVADGHEIGNHSMSHADLTKLDLAGLRREWEATSKAIERIVGFPAPICRPPGGQANLRVIVEAAKLRMQSVYWTANSKDFDSNDVETVRRAIVSGASNGAIILLHDKVYHTVMALDAAIPLLQEKGFEFVSVGEMASLDDSSDDRKLVPSSWLK